MLNRTLRICHIARLLPIVFLVLIFFVSKNAVGQTTLPEYLFDDFDYGASAGDDLLGARATSNTCDLSSSPLLRESEWRIKTGSTAFDSTMRMWYLDSWFDGKASLPISNPPDGGAAGVVKFVDSLDVPTGYSNYTTDTTSGIRIFLSPGEYPTTQNWATRILSGFTAEYGTWAARVKFVDIHTFNPSNPSNEPRTHHGFWLQSENSTGSNPNEPESTRSGRWDELDHEFSNWFGTYDTGTETIPGLATGIYPNANTLSGSPGFGNAHVGMTAPYADYQPPGGCDESVEDCRSCFLSYYDGIDASSELNPARGQIIPEDSTLSYPLCLDYFLGEGTGQVDKYAYLWIRSTPEEVSFRIVIYFEAQGGHPHAGQVTAMRAYTRNPQSWNNEVNVSGEPPYKFKGMPSRPLSVKFSNTLAAGVDSSFEFIDLGSPLNFDIDWVYYTPEYDPQVVSLGVIKDDVNTIKSSAIDDVNRELRVSLPLSNSAFNSVNFTLTPEEYDFDPSTMYNCMELKNDSIFPISIEKVDSNVHAPNTDSRYVWELDLPLERGGFLVKWNVYKRLFSGGAWKPALSDSTSGAVLVTGGDASYPHGILVKATVQATIPDKFVTSSDSIAGYTYPVSDTTSYFPNASRIQDQGKGGSSSGYVTEMQIFPTIAASDATIALALATSSDIVLRAYDVLGRRVIDQSHAGLALGEHDLQLNVSALASGVYFVNVDIKPLENGQATTLRRRVVVVR